MPPSALLDKAQKPDEKILADLLGKSYKILQDLRKNIAETCGQTTEDWKFYGTKYGWTMKTLLKKRNLFFFVPQKNSFTIGFIFGDKAVEAARKSDLPQNIIDELLVARKYAEGRGISLDIKNSSQLKIIKSLLRIKVEN